MDADLAATLARLNRERGPVVVVARPHSGTRLLAEILARAGVYMGNGVTPGFLDSEPWYRGFVFPLVVSDWFPDWDRHWEEARFRRFADARLSATLDAYLRGERPSGPWGWKLSESFLVMPLLWRYFPGAFFVHLVRDGRDVILSDDGWFQLTLRARSRWPRHELAWWLDRVGLRPDPYGRFCRRVTFGDDPGATWRGLDLRRGAVVRRNRFLLQMQSWVHCVTTARDYGRRMPESYHEIRYERLCDEPMAVTRELCDRLGLPVTSDLESHLRTAVRPERRRRWPDHEFRGAEAEDFERAVRLGMPLLAETGR